MQRTSLTKPYNISGSAMSMSTSFLGLPSAPPAYSLALALAGAVYGAVFLMLSNHYVFKPKVEQYLANSSLSSKASTQFLVDFISSLPHLTFILCSMVISNSDSALSVMVYSDLGWSGLYLGLLAFGGVGSKEGGNWRLMLLKNIVCLGLAYATIWLHYLSCNYLVTLGLVLALLYLLNLLANAHEERLVSAMQFLFQYKPVEEQQRREQRNRMVSIEYLARHFPVAPEQIREKIRIYEKEVKNIKIKPKSLVAQSLMKVALAVHLSRLKREAKARRDVKSYYGTFNGTVGERSKRIIVEKPATNDEAYSIEQSEVRGQGEEEIDSCIFYIFPVKLLENSRGLSVCFSLLINLGYGVLLSLVLFLTDGLPGGAYAHLFYGFLLLPLLPSASKVDFLASMTLSSLWKYCLYGLVLSFLSLARGSAAAGLAPSPTLAFSPAIQLLALCLLSYMSVGEEQPKYRILFVWMAATAANAAFIFKST